MDYESVDSRSKGCWDPAPILMPFFEKWSSRTATPDFVVDDVWCEMVGSLGFGGGVTPETVQYWKIALKDIYRGDEGRKKVRMAVLCLLERDGLLLRLGDITCPVYWLQVSLPTRCLTLLARITSKTSYQPDGIGYRRCPLRPKGPNRTNSALHLV